MQKLHQFLYKKTAENSLFILNFTPDFYRTRKKAELKIGKNIISKIIETSVIAPFKINTEQFADQKILHKIFCLYFEKYQQFLNIIAVIDTIAVKIIK